MQNFLMGLVAGIVLAVIGAALWNLIKPKKPYAKIHLDEGIKDIVFDICLRLELKPTEAIQTMFKYGFAALYMYSQGQGGIFVKKEDGTIVPISVFPKEDDHWLKPFMSFFDKE